MKKKLFFSIFIFSAISFFSFSNEVFTYSNDYKTFKTYSDFRNYSANEKYQDESPFELKAPLDIPLLTFTSLLSVSSLVADYGVKKLNWTFKDNEYNPEKIKKSDIAIMDQIFMTSYKKPISIISTVTAGLSIASSITILPLVNSKKRVFSTREFFTDGLMFYESMSLAWGIKEWVKIFVNRPRPYMYYEDSPRKKVLSGDWNDSFFSGHTTMAFASASFLTYTFFQYYPEEKTRFWVLGLSYSLATATAILRMASGSHFCTDVLAGAIIGTVSGIALPYMHTKFFYSKFKKKKNDDIEFYISPTATVLTLRF